ncbi:DUF305 domain-containing protein [Candidatus Saccharibacteria bacterium]|nr:DUF305 domain-containing protein [Candidatus Saccharibacteria bacterium]
MESKSLLFGIIGFILGGLIVSVAATATPSDTDSQTGHSMNMSSNSLSSKSGKEFDKAFLSQMIEHHQGALEMAELAETKASHIEIKQFSNTVIDVQSKEIEALQTLQQKWGYKTNSQ